LSANATVVLDSPGLASEVCGANDSNLRVLEELLDARIHSRGNELFLEGSDGTTGDTLLRVLEELKQYVRLGQPVGPELIRSVYSSMTDESAGEALRSKSVEVSSGRTVYPRSAGQASYVEAMGTQDLVFGIGPAGTGKTYLAVAHALREVLARRKRKLILTRPVVEAGERLGYLPGDLAQKLHPYLRPLYDAMESLIPPETMERLEENRIIEISPLAYMRGRSLNDCCVILDEAQNTTREQMKMFLTRLGEGTTAVVTGDITQIDLSKAKDSGLLHVVRLLSGIPGIHFSYFTSRDVVRSRLVKRIVEAYEANEQRE
jgi:phosphate starvation-inducible protein PhoH and related proteins